MLLAVVAVYLWTVLSGRPEGVIRSTTFAALVFGNLALILVNRSIGASEWAGALAAGIIGVTWFEIYKAWARR